ncbi:YdcF family protein [Spirulina major]|uniref:YdcF family protein n=1 Tax=Spirulina major TaxID=270636 RepID=UPI0009328800|nr:YdcF family protein [Spirulina major]
MFKRKLPRPLRWIVVTSAIAVLTFNLHLLAQLHRAHQASPQPEAILVLGGDFEREYVAAYFAQEHPGLDLWISSGMPEAKSRAYFAQVGVDPQRLNYDRRAVDTVTNFTTMGPVFHAQNIRHLYLITSDFHLGRARFLAYLIFGHYGITVTPIAVPTQTPNESWWEIVRDGGRGVLWILTGYTVEKTRG